MRAKSSLFVAVFVFLEVGLLLRPTPSCGQTLSELWNTELPSALPDFIAAGMYYPGREGLLFGYPTQGCPGEALRYEQLLLLDGRTGSVSWTYVTACPTAVVGLPYMNVNFGPQFRDINGDGLPELLFMTTDRRVHCFQALTTTSTLDPNPPQQAVPQTPGRFAVGPSVPNPATAGVQFALSVPGPTPVEVTILDVLGRVVRTIRRDADKGGDFTLSWDGLDSESRAVASGTYYYRVRTNVGETTRATVWLR